jgi:hypothetical protein
MAYRPANLIGILIGMQVCKDSAHTLPAGTTIGSALLEGRQLCSYSATSGSLPSSQQQFIGL